MILTVILLFFSILADKPLQYKALTDITDTAEDASK